MNKYNITYIDGNGHVCIKLVTAADKDAAWEDFIKYHEYANVLHIDQA